MLSCVVSVFYVLNFLVIYVLPTYFWSELNVDYFYDCWPLINLPPIAWVSNHFQRQ
jgi:hypothetical protein